MSEHIRDFKRKKDFMICVDSDGCAMDTMDIKHIRCFGPCMVAEWHLEEWEDAILSRWNEINLYTMTRGVNRFKGLAMALGEIQERYCKIEGLDVFAGWTEESPELSNDALEAFLAGHDNICVRKALAWSRAVNKSITQLPEEEIRPYEGVREALEQAHAYADIAVVSSANPGAVLAEWKKHHLLEHTDIVLAQDVGSKAYCIGELLKAGYARDHVLMCGDAPGDLAAAQKNGVLYYPILVRHEVESWAEFLSQALGHLTDGTYENGYQQKKIDAFWKIWAVSTIIISYFLHIIKKGGS